MLDFTDSGYLGLRHASAELPAWRSIAAGRPAALQESRLADALARGVAQLQGVEDGVVGSSSLLLAMDALGPALRDGPWRVMADRGCYPTLLWAAAQGGPPEPIGHHDPSALADALARVGPGVRPLLTVDGFCPGCGRLAPLAAYARLLTSRAGRLFVDDTQALGVIGPRGAGSLAAAGLPITDLLCVASLAKGFGAPIAVLSGPRRLIEAFRRDSATRMHTSPPAWPAVLAGVRALVIDRRCGGRLRQRLRGAIAVFRRFCAARGVPLLAGAFPIQTVAATVGCPHRLVAALRCRGIRTFASRSFHDRRAHLRLIVTANHTEPELACAADALAMVLAAWPRAVQQREDALT